MPAPSPTPFRLDVPESTLDRIAERVRAFDWSGAPDADGGAWQLGPPSAYMRALAARWLDGFDWRAEEAALNALAQFRAPVDGQPLHFVHERGSARPSGAAPVPLLLLHGWPYSFASFRDVVGPLAHPERFGGDAEDACDVVVASLPGFGFSTPLPSPMGPKRMADLLDRLMTEVLGYPRYVAQGGDWGGYVASQLGFHHPEHVLGVHSTSFMVRHDGAAMGSGQAGPDATGAERAFAAKEQQGFAFGGAYAMIMGTRPGTLAYAMSDSPLGQAAWMAEKFVTWSDGGAHGERAPEQVVPFDRVLTEVMVYLTGGTAATASWIYTAYMPENSATLPPGRRVEVPTAFSAYRDPAFPAPPRAFMERSHRVVRWTDMPRGGHFPMLEVPDLFVDDVRAFVRVVR